MFLLYKFIVKCLPISVKKRLRSNKYLEKLNLSLRVRFKPEFIITRGDNHKIYLDAKDSLHLSIHKNWEQFETDIIKSYVKEGDVVLDLGANIGYYTLLLARLVGEDGMIYAFEPEPSNFDLLKRNIKANGYRNIIAVQKAVSDKNEKIKLYLQKDNLTSHTIVPLQKTVYERGKLKEIILDKDNVIGLDFVEVESVTLDNFFKDKKQKINFVKMDVEGAEGKTIKGMQRLINENKDIKIISEFMPLLLKACGVGYEEFFGMLEEFEFYNINELQNRLELLNPKDVTIESNRTNLLFFRNKFNEIQIR